MVTPGTGVVGGCDEYVDGVGAARWRRGAGRGREVGGAAESDLGEFVTRAAATLAHADAAAEAAAAAFRIWSEMGPTGVE
jgi:hypothetical protein